VARHIHKWQGKKQSYGSPYFSFSGAVSAAPVLRIDQNILTI
jgi:hypothetical protein